MNNKGFISVEYLFSILILLIIATSLLFLAQYLFTSNDSVESSIEDRLILDSIANEINMINSNGENFSKVIQIPKRNYSYEIEIEENKLILSHENRKGSSMIFSVDLEPPNKKLYSGHSYRVEKIEEEKIMIT